MRILFQGDSITDALRSRENDTNFGTGYALLVKASLGFEEPGKYEFLNRGVSGNRIVNLYARMKCDILNLKPDVMSILIGVNDVFHDFKESPNGVDAEKFYKIYDMLITEVKEALPDLKIMILEPFVLQSGMPEEQWKIADAEVRKRAEMAKKIAEKHQLTFGPLQDGFCELAKNGGDSYWIGDGVHPTTMGHEYIKNEWLKAFKEL